MTDITPNKIAEWKRLCDAASEGPWRTSQSPRSPNTIVFFAQNAGGFDLRHSPDPEANVAFIAAAREALPALIAENELLRADLSRMVDSKGALANVSLSTVRDFEKGRRVPIGNNLNAMKGALEGKGIAFTENGLSVPEN